MLLNECEGKEVGESCTLGCTVGGVGRNIQLMVLGFKVCGSLNFRDKGISVIYGLKNVKNKLERKVIRNEDIKGHKIVSFIQVTNFIEKMSFFLFTRLYTKISSF